MRNPNSDNKYVASTSGEMKISLEITPDVPHCIIVTRPDRSDITLCRDDGGDMSSETGSLILAQCVAAALSAAWHLIPEHLQNDEMKASMIRSILGDGVRLFEVRKEKVIAKDVCTFGEQPG